MSYRTQKIITIALLLLTLFDPLLGVLGLVAMWSMMKWPTWVKVIVTIPFTLLFILLIFMPILLFTYIFAYRPFQMSGDSMMPTYHREEYLLSKIISFNEEKIDRSDIIIHNHPIESDRAFSRRVVGLPGERVMIKEGLVFIDGVLLNESSYLQANTRTEPGSFLKEGEEKTIRQNEYFVLADNRQKGTDSRDLGFINRKDIISKVLFCYWNCK